MELSLNKLLSEMAVKKDKEVNTLNTVQSKLDSVDELKNLQVKAPKHQSDNLFRGKDVTSKNATMDSAITNTAAIALRCKNHPSEKVSKAIRSIDKAVEQNKKGSELNLCPVEDAEEKRIKNLKIKDSDRAASGKEEMGDFKSWQEKATWQAVNEVINELIKRQKTVEAKRAFEKCKIYPDSLYGKKTHFESSIGLDKSGHPWDIDVYIKFSPYLALKTGARGVAFLVDGNSVHSGETTDEAKFTGDLTRQKSRSIPFRISVKGKRTQNTEQAIKDNVKKDLFKVLEHIIDPVNLQIKTEHEVSRSQGDETYSEQFRQAQKNKLDQSMFERLVSNLRNRKSLSDNYDDQRNPTSGDNYLSMGRIKSKLSSYLEASNEKGQSKGRESFRKYPELWKQLIDASTEQMQAWKNKHQANKTGRENEKVLEIGRDGNIKLFENEEN